MGEEIQMIPADPAAERLNAYLDSLPGIEELALMLMLPAEVLGLVRESDRRVEEALK